MTHKTQPTAHAEITAPISADLRGIDDAGAQPAPAQLPKTLRELAEVVHDWGKRDQAWAHPDPDCFDVALFGHISEDGEPYPVAEVNADTYGHVGVSLQLAQFYAAASPAAVLALLDRVELRDNEMKAARAETKHWRSNHDNVVARLRIFTQRPDIPKELADRLPWYRELVRLQEVEAQAAAKCQHQGAAPAPVTYMAEDNACKWAWDHVREDVGTEGWTAGDSGTFHGFFLWGWNYRGQYETQRPAAPPAPAAVAVPYELIRAARQALACMDGLRQHLGCGVCSIEADALRAALAAAPAQAPEQWIDDPHDIEQGRMLNPEWVRAQEHATQLAGQALPADEFRGDTASLVRNIVALLDLDAQGCLVPHGVGGHARGLLSAAASRLAAPAQAQGCTRSHPHENMSPMCVLRTEIARLNHAAAVAQAQDPFQQRVQPWLLACFGAEIAGDKQERNHRFLEEAVELVQANGCTASEAHQLVDYVFGRPVGEPAQEVGGVMVTPAALCLASGLDMHQSGEVELQRIWGKVEQIRAKQAAKPKHSPLPAAPAQAQEDARNLETEALRACRDLPEGWEIEIHLERGYGVVTVIDPQGNDDELPVEGTLFDALKETIDTAIRDDAARAAQGGAA